MFAPYCPLLLSIPAPGGGFARREQTLGEQALRGVRRPLAPLSGSFPVECKARRLFTISAGHIPRSGMSGAIMGRLSVPAPTHWPLFTAERTYEQHFPTSQPETASLNMTKPCLAPSHARHETDFLKEWCRLQDSNL